MLYTLLCEDYVFYSSVKIRERDIFLCLIADLLRIRSSCNDWVEFNDVSLEMIIDTSVMWMIRNHPSHKLLKRHIEELFTY